MIQITVSCDISGHVVFGRDVWNDKQTHMHLCRLLQSSICSEMTYYHTENVKQMPLMLILECYTFDDVLIGCYEQLTI